MTEWGQYEDFVVSIIRKCGIIRTRTLVTCLCKYYQDMSREKAQFIISKLQDHVGYFLTEDGFTLTREMYVTITKDFNEDNANFSDPVKIKAGQVIVTEPYHLAILDCMCVVADFMPQSYLFSMPENSYPWLFQFIAKDEKSDKPPKLYQVCKIQNGYELPFALMLAGSSYANDAKAFKDSIRRIAIIEDEASAFMVPHLGFSAIIMYDKSSPTEFRLIEKRSGDNLWSDFDEAKEELEDLRNDL